MAKFFGVKLSDNIIKRHDGFLICMGAVIARSGFQVYKGSEVDKEELDNLGVTVTDEQEVKVLRLYEDVFRRETLASFEGTVFTLTHPGKLVTVETVNENNQGHIQNVRIGNEPLPDGNWPMIADIYVTGQEAIDAILIDGVRELSCGYNYKLKVINGNICQCDIVGNHVALVESGRAGKYAAIKDSTPQEGITFMADKFSNKLLRAFGLHALAHKSTPEQFAAALDAVALDATEEAKDNENNEVEDMEHEAGCKGKDNCTCKSGKDSKPEAKDSDFRARMHAALDRKIDDAAKAQAMDDDSQLTVLLGGKVAKDAEEKSKAEDEEKEAEDDDIEGEDSEEEGEDSEEEEAHDSEEEEVEGEDEAVQSEASPVIPSEARFKSYVPSATDAAAYRAGAKSILTMLKPVIAQSGNKKMIKAFDTATKTVKGKAFGRDGYKAFASAAGTRSKAAMDAQPKTVAQSMKAAADVADAAYAEVFRKG